MKNLFKNLMLVAVAAMAFTACTETNDEVNAVSKITRYEFTANIADETRSGFAEKEEGATAYKSEWHDGDQIKIFVNGYDPIVKNISVDGKFEFELTDAPESFSMTVCSPAESWTNENGYIEYIIPTEQAPLANSVDPKAHLLRALNVPVINGVADINMTHMAAYGKMTVNAPDFAIKKVEVSFNGGQVYTINADNVQKNTFWFATQTLDVTEFTVTAYDAEGNAVAKTVDVAAAGKELKFQLGRVSTFSVSGLKEYVEPEPEGLVFTAAEMINKYSTNDVMVSFTGDGLEEMQINFYGAAMVNGSLNVGTFTIGNGLYDGYCFYGDTQLDTITIVSTFENGVYNLVFSNLKDNNGNAVVEGDLTFTGLISGLTPVDLRTQLATPNVTWSVEGKTITLSWDDVEGAKEYYVFCYNGGLDALTTTETTVTFDAEYSTSYDFLVRAVADENDANYRDSDDFYIEGKITTGKDPNKWADVVATGIQWDNSNSCFTLTAPGFSYINLEVNSANRPNNNSLVVGDYTYGQSENQFRINYNNGYFFGYSDIKNTSTMTVDFVDGQYVILLDVTSLYGGFVGTIGYKGMPEGWVAPTGGESGGDEPEQPVALETPVVSSSVTGNEVVVSWSAINGAANYTVTLGSQSQTVDGTSVTFSNLEYSTSYTVSVVANPADTTANIASEAGTASFTTEAEPEQPGDGGVTVKYVQNFGSGYEYIRYYELTSGNDVIGFWMNNNKSSNTTMNDGTYTNNNGGLSKVAGNASTIYIDKNVIDGENKGGVQNTSKMVVSNNGGHIEFKLEYWDTSVQAFVIKEYVFDGTIQ